MAIGRNLSTPLGRQFARSRSPALSPARKAALVRTAFACAAAAADLGAILFGVLAAGGLTFLYKYEIDEFAARLCDFGLLIAALFLLTNLFHGEYVFERYLVFRKHVRRCGLAWMLTFLNAVAIEFMTKTTTDLSRAAVCFFLTIGFLAVLCERFAMVRVIRRGAERGEIALRRMFLVGYESEIDAFYERYQLDPFGLRVVTASVLRGPDSLDEDLALAAASARICRPEDVFILVPWADKETVERCVNAFLRVPASIHLGQERILDRFAEAKVASTGPISSINLARPLAPGRVLAKRLFDVVVSSAALACLSPCSLASRSQSRSTARGRRSFGSGAMASTRSLSESTNSAR